MADFVSKLLKNIGLVGPTTFTPNSLVPSANTPNALQRSQQDFVTDGTVANPDIWQRYGAILQGPATYDQMMRLWDEMSSWDLMAAALSEVTEEVIATDPNSPGTLWYECNDADFEDELNDLLLDLGTEEILARQVWHVAGLGNNFEKIDYAPKVGVTGLTFIHPFECRRYWIEKNRGCIGFRWNGHKPNKDDIYVDLKNSQEIPRVSLGSSSANMENLWYPWDMLHMRRMFRHGANEHGEPLFYEAQGIYKKMRMAIDQMVVHRAQIQPDRYSIKVDVQEQTPTEQMKTIQRWKQSFRAKMSFGSGSGSNSFSEPSELKNLYNPLALDTIIWVAQPKGFQHAIDKLQGTASIPDVYDIELLTDLFYSIIGMPKSWFGFAKDGSSAPSGKALLAQDVRFLRKVKSIRKPIINAYTWLAYFHAVLKGKNVDDLEIKAKMSEISGLEDQMRMEVLEKQANVLNILSDVMKNYNLPKQAWAEVVFKKYMHMPDEVVDAFMTALPAEDIPEGKKPAPRIGRLLKEIEDRLPKSTPAFVELKKSLYGDDRNVSNKRFTKRYRTAEDVLKLPKMEAGDIIYGTNSQLKVSQIDEADKVHGRSSKLEPLVESAPAAPLAEAVAPKANIAWRKFIPESH